MSDDAKTSADAPSIGRPVEEIQKGRTIYSDVIARYYGDPDFRRRLEADPTGVLNSMGFTIPPGRKAKLVPPEDKVLHVVVPYPEPGA